MPITKKGFGETAAGRAVTAYEWHGRKDVIAEVIDYGAVLRTLKVLGKSGKMVDVVLGFKDVAAYERGSSYLGAVIGRVAGRVARGEIRISGTAYELSRNDHGNHLHGGTEGFDRKIFSGECDRDTLRLKYVSRDGEEGYPGTLEFTIAYTITEDKCRIEYEAATDADTALSPTQHTYFNLDGEAAGTTVDGQRLMIDAEKFCEMAPGAVATGKIMDVAGTPFDFRKEKEIGREIMSADKNLHAVGGYDHCFVLNKEEGSMMQPAAVLYSDRTGIEMRLQTTLPMMQVYAGMYLPVTEGKGAWIGPRRGIALEAQGWPNAFATRNFPRPLLKSGDRYYEKTLWEFRLR